MLTRERIEGEVRRVVARHLGVSRGVLEPDVCLRDGLGSDAQALEALVLAVEDRMGVRMPERVLDEVRSYGELVAATIEAIRAGLAAERRGDELAPRGRVRIAGTRAPAVERAGVLTGYLLEAVCEDARRAGPGASVTVSLAGSATDAQLESVRERLEAVRRLGITVDVVRRGSGVRTGS